MIYALVLGLWGKHDFPRREQRSTDEQGCRSHVDVSRRVRRGCKRWGRRGFRLVLLGRRRGLHSEDAIRHDVSGLRAEHLRGLMAEVGALVSGRRTFERAGGWGGQHPWDIPAFVAAHDVPDGWPPPGSTVQFVTDGIESAVARAKSAAA